MRRLTSPTPTPSAISADGRLYVTERIVVLGGGFAGLWSALGAARARDEAGVGADRLEIVLINDTAWHSIRVRNYEADLGDTRVSLDSVLGPVGVRRLEGMVT